MAASERAAEREQDMILLAELIDQAGALNARKAEVEREYKEKRAAVDALLVKYGIVGPNPIPGGGGEYEAVRDHEVESFIDPAVLAKKVGTRKFRDCVRVVLERAKVVLGPEQYTELLKSRKKDEPTLRIRKVGSGR